MKGFSIFSFHLIYYLIYGIYGQILSNTTLDEDFYRNSVEFIESRGFEAQTYTVVTEDQYILTVFRIVNPYISEEQRNQTTPVILWHGIAGNSDSWLVSRKGVLNEDGVYSEDNGSVINDCSGNFTSTLSYTLAACGYDVWLANSRGGQYSNKHESLNENQPEYSDYTLTELALYDIPSVVEHILKITNKDSLSFIGHSMATTTMFILLSLKPEFERFINCFIALAPVAYFESAKSNVVELAPVEPIARPLKFPLGLTPKSAEWLGSYICSDKLFIDICIDMFGQTYGSDPYNLDKERFGIVLANSLDKTSIRVFLHFAQIINSKRFHYFNYPTIYENYRKYGRMTAPDYPLNKISSKNIVIFESLNDYLSNPSDVNKLVKQLKVPLLARHTIAFKYWNHADYVWAKYANKYLNPIILKTLNDKNELDFTDITYNII